METGIATQAIIFDRDGVLCFFDMQPLTQLCMSLNIPLSSIRQAWQDTLAQSQAIDVVLFWQQIASINVLSSDQLAQFQQFDVDSCVRMYSDVEATFQLLARQGIKIGILSNFVVPTQIKRSLAFVRSYINSIVSSTETGYRKPAYQSYHVILSQLNLPAEGCIFIDDQQPNVQAALNLGMSGIVLDRTTLTQSLDDLLATFLHTEPQPVYDMIPVNTLCVLAQS